MKQIQVSSNRRFLALRDGRPFFYLGDTVWELFHRYSILDAETYLRDRAAKGFTVVQAVALAEFEGLTRPNPQGNLPLTDMDPEKPNEAYFQDVDQVVGRANALGLTVGFLPTWGDKWNQKWGSGPEIFNPQNARSFGRFLGHRYQNANLIWILGGDRPIETEEHREIIRAMAEGLQDGDGGNHLRCFHPMGGQTSAQYFHEEDWLDFNMWQSGHSRNCPNFDCVDADYAKNPPKPCMDAEPGYEDHPAGFDVDNGFLDAYDCRKSLYWGLFAGAMGHTYGCHPIWQKFERGGPGISAVRTDWREALHLPGSGQMRHAKALLSSRPYFSRIPDPGLIVGEAGIGSRHIQATRDDEGRYALIYIPSNQGFEIDLDRLAGESLIAHWFDPRTGVADLIGKIPRLGTRRFETPSGGPDWILVLDEEAQNFSRPGMDK